MGEYKYELFGCFGNFGLTVLTYCFPCVTVGRNAESLGMTSCFMGGCLLFVPIYNIIHLYNIRKTANEKVGVEPNLLTDCFVAYVLWLCSTVQIRREFDCDALGEQTIERV